MEPSLILRLPRCPLRLFRSQYRIFTTVTGCWTLVRSVLRRELTQTFTHTAKPRRFIRWSFPGAIYATELSSIPFVEDVSLTENTASEGRGGLYIIAPTALHVHGAKFEHNHAQFGGAIAMKSTGDGEKTFNACTFDSNTAAADGGAMHLYTSAGQERIHTSWFQNNFAGTTSMLL